MFRAGCGKAAARAPANCETVNTLGSNGAWPEWHLLKHAFALRVATYIPYTKGVATELRREPNSGATTEERIHGLLATTLPFSQT